MQDQNWKQVKAILLDALEMDARKRQAYLDSLGLSQAIRSEVDSLLDLERSAELWSPSTALDLSRDLICEDPAENTLVGQKIGIYQIVEEIGFGGTGAVFLAERIDGKFEQRVAIKVLRREFATPNIRQFFIQEREIQAALVHPNTATLLDAGTTPDGAPYLVMEYVDGLRIDKFCSENDLDLNGRLRLFNKVCEAVSFAHRNLVIHRDIKPSNILVTENGEAKLLDFGFSKLIATEGDNANAITHIGALTPAYASPEQIKGEPVTTSTDIYSLGVVLFKMLTQSLPYDSGNGTGVGILSEITTSDPWTPSEVIKRNPKSVIRSTQLKGDLDNIILKALRKDPEERYQTVEQFAADIKRFIEGAPILARPSTVFYRTRKFYGRNKVSVTAAALVILTLIGGISVATWQASVASANAAIAMNARQEAEIEAQRSRSEEERAKGITKFMEKIISYANPGPYAEGSRAGGDAKVIDVINELSSRIEIEFPGQLDIQAELHHKFAEVYLMRRNSLSLPSLKENALSHAARALELRKQHYGNEHELVAKDIYYLWAIGDTSDPGPLARSVKMMRETNPQNINLPFMLTDYAVRLAGLRGAEAQKAFYMNAITDPTVSEYELAEAYLEESLPLYRLVYDDSHPALQAARCHLSFVQFKLGNIADALQTLQSCSLIKDAANADTRKHIKEYEIELNRNLPQ